MCILNIALQGVGLARTEMKEEVEKEFRKCNGLNDIRKLAATNEEVQPELLKSVKGLTDMLNVLFRRLKLKEKPFRTQDPATDAEMDSLWNEILKVDSTLLKTDTTADKVNKKQVFMEFLRTHCCERNYVFAVKKCGSGFCNICKPPRRRIFWSTFLTGSYAKG